MQQARELLQARLGNQAKFRLRQWEAIEAVAVKRQRALLVRRTDWGKSIVYFLATRDNRHCLPKNLMFPIFVSRFNGGPQILPRRIAGYCTVRRQNEPFGGLLEHIGGGLPDRFRITRSEDALPFHATHEWSPKHLRYIFWGQSPISHLQATIDYVTWVIQERRQIVVSALIVTNM